jgi:hypothetical protein
MHVDSRPTDDGAGMQAGQGLIGASVRLVASIMLVVRNPRIATCTCIAGCRSPIGRSSGTSGACERLRWSIAAGTANRRSADAAVRVRIDGCAEITRALHQSRRGR